MTELLTAAQMRAIEHAVIASGKVTGLELMERAGRGVVEAIFEEWPELAKTSHRAVVLCGPGNNGGDGFVVARVLHEWGWEVEVFLYGDPDKLPPDAKVNYERWLLQNPVHDYAQFVPCETLNQADSPDIVWLFVDAIFGTGLSRVVENEIELHEKLYLATCEVIDGRRVSVDLPSGLCSDSGRTLLETVHDVGSGRLESELTVTFHSRKLGHVLAKGAAFCGKTVVKSIGLEGSVRPRAEAKRPPMGAVGRCPAVPPSDIVKLIEKPLGARLLKWSGAHKYGNGHALILSGGPCRTGAARMAARGALRIGAGLVTLGVPPSAQMEVASQITALMLKRVEDGAGLAELLNDGRLNALCLGPGLGSGDRERALILAALEAKRPTVLDADALSILFFDEADAFFGKLHAHCVLTPHGGEFARMFPDIAEKLNASATKGPAYSKVDATREAAKRAGCVVLFKGPDTVIADPEGRCSINSAQYERAAPWLATAGSGDVLAGFITGLLARGFAPMQAAEMAAWLHVECARSFGPGLIAEDLPEELPKVFRDMGM